MFSLWFQFTFSWIVEGEIAWDLNRQKEKNVCRAFSPDDEEPQSLHQQTPPQPRAVKQFLYLDLLYCKAKRLFSFQF